MICDKVLSDGTLLLRTIEPGDCTEEYLSWLNNPLVNRFLETRWESQTLDKIREFVDAVRRSPDSCLFAMIDAASARHIGNIKLGPINTRYRHADISYFIGEVDFWGKGYATRAIELICDYGFSELELHRIQAGVFPENAGSVKALQKAGFVLEARLREALISPVSGLYCDHIFMGRLNPRH